MSTNASRSAKKDAPREAPLALIVIAIVMLVIVLGAGGFYAYNGGWKTHAQQEQEYKHTLLPIIAARHGDRSALDAENALRRQNGQAPLDLPKDRAQKAVSAQQQLVEVRKKLLEKMGQPPQ